MGATEAPAPILLCVIQPVLGGRAGTGVARPEDKKEKRLHSGPLMGFLCRFLGPWTPTGEPEAARDQETVNESESSEVRMELPF